MEKLETKTKLIFIIFFMNITTCDNASEIQDCGRKQVSFEDEVNYEDRGSHAAYPRTTESYSLGNILFIGLSGALAVAAAPVVLAGAGFTAGGIAAGSYAAGMMSTAAIANGGGVAAGSAVALGQALGAVGLGAAGKAAVGVAGAAAGAAVSAALN